MNPSSALYEYLIIDELELVVANYYTNAPPPSIGQTMNLEEMEMRGVVPTYRVVSVDVRPKAVDKESRTLSGQTKVIIHVTAIEPDN